MFNFFKRAEAKKYSSLWILSSSWKKKNFLDIFKVNAFILTAFIISLVVSWLVMVEITANNLEIEDRKKGLVIDYNKLLEVKNTLWFINWLKTQTFDGKKIINILNYLEELDLYSYKLEFNPTKQYFYVQIKSINQNKLDDIISKWLKSGTMNYFRTNETLKIIEKWKVSISLIFN